MIWSEEWAICSADSHSEGASEDIESSVHGAGSSHLRVSRGALSAAGRLAVRADAVLLRDAETAAHRAMSETRPGK